MTRWMATLALALFLMPLFGCASEGKPAPEVARIEAPAQVDVVYGDGGELAIRDRDAIAGIVRELNRAGYEVVDLPDAVGQSFTLRLGGDAQYASTGYLRIDGTLYRATDEDAVAAIDRAVMALKPR